MLHPFLALCRLWALIRAAALGLVIWDTRRYLAECQADGILEGESLRAFRAQLEIDEWRRAQLLEQAGRTVQQHQRAGA